MGDTALPARVLDAVRGGFDNSADDEDFAKQIMAAHEGARQMLRWCNRFSAAAAGYAAGSGLRGVIIGNAGFPAGEQPHHSSRPGTWCAYADGPEAVTAAREDSVSEEDGDVRAVALTACMTEPAEVMHAVEAARLPPGLLQVQLGLSPALRAEPGVRFTVARWAYALRARGLSGSQVTLLVPLGGYLSLPGVFGKPAVHAPGDIPGWFGSAGLELLSPVTDVRAWGREWEEESLRVRGDTRIAAVIAVLP